METGCAACVDVGIGARSGSRYGVIEGAAIEGIGVV